MRKRAWMARYIPLLVSAVALVLSGLAYCDSHRTAMANLVPRRELVAHGLYIYRHAKPEDGYQDYVLALCNKGNRGVMLALGALTISRKGQSPDENYYVLKEPVEIAPGSVGLVRLLLPYNLTRPNPTDSQPSSPSGGRNCIQLYLVAVWSDGKKYQLILEDVYPSFDILDGVIMRNFVNSVNVFEECGPQSTEWFTEKPFTR